MERNIDKGLQELLENFKGDLSVYFPKLEANLEKGLIEFLDKVGIQASVKSDKYSLPYQEEVIIKIKYQSYINDMTKLSIIFRPILKELLTKNVYKIRFYFHIETFANEDKSFFGALNKGFKYSFRYYIHN